MVICYSSQGKLIYSSRYSKQIGRSMQKMGTHKVIQRALGADVKGLPLGQPEVWRLQQSVVYIAMAPPFWNW